MIASLLWHEYREAYPPTPGTRSKSGEAGHLSLPSAGDIGVNSGAKTSEVTLIHKAPSLVYDLKEDLSKCLCGRDSVRTQRPQIAMTDEGGHVSARAATRRDTLALLSSARTRLRARLRPRRFSPSPHSLTRLIQLSSRNAGFSGPTESGSGEVL